MKISGLVIQDRKISVNNENTFHARYKGKTIQITTDHGFGEPKYDHLKRFMIDVWDDKTGMNDVSTYEDCHCIEDAIREALIGACLLKLPG